MTATKLRWRRRHSGARHPLSKWYVGGGVQHVGKVFSTITASGMRSGSTTSLRFAERCLAPPSRHSDLTSSVVGLGGVEPQHMDNVFPTTTAIGLRSDSVTSLRFTEHGPWPLPTLGSAVVTPPPSAIESVGGGREPQHILNMFATTKASGLQDCSAVSLRFAEHRCSEGHIGPAAHIRCQVCRHWGQRCRASCHLQSVGQRLAKLPPPFSPIPGAMPSDSPNTALLTHAHRCSTARNFSYTTHFPTAPIR